MIRTQVYTQIKNVSGGFGGFSFGVTGFCLSFGVAGFFFGVAVGGVAVVLSFSFLLRRLYFFIAFLVSRTSRGKSCGESATVAGAGAAAAAGGRFEFVDGFLCWRRIRSANLRPALAGVGGGALTVGGSAEPFLDSPPAGGGVLGRVGGGVLDRVGAGPSHAARFA